MLKHIKVGFSCLLFLTISCKSDKENTKTEVPQNISTTPVFKAEKTMNSHFAKTQFYRWYQLYEREMSLARIQNQMEMLADSILIETARGSMKGKNNYPPRLTVYKGWKNAHHVQNANVVTTEDGHTQLTAAIVYNNIQPNGDTANYAIDYIVDFESNENEKLPKIAKVNIKPTGKANDTFKDSYAKNRASSLVYYWLANVEQLDGNVEPFKELLTNDFKLNFSTTSQINSIEKLNAWLNGAPKQLTQSSHHVEKLEVTQIDQTTFKAIAVFDWYGISKKNQKMKAKTHHTWIIKDNINERFARIQKADVKQIEPFTIIK